MEAFERALESAETRYQALLNLEPTNPNPNPLSPPLGAPGSSGTDAQGDYVVAPQPTVDVVPEKPIATPEVTVELNGEPIDIFGVVFDPTTGETSKGAAPTAEVEVKVKELPRVPVDVDAIRTYGRGYDYMAEAREQLENFRELRTELQGFTGADDAFAALSDSILAAGESGEISKYQLQELLDLIEQMSGKTVDIKVKPTVETDVPLLGPKGAQPTAEFDRGAAVGPGETEISPDDEWDRLFDRNNDLILDAGEKFNQQVADAGVAFTKGLASALADGKLTGDEASGLFGGLGGSLGGLAGTAIGGPLGGIVGEILGGLLGSAIGGLFPDEESDSRSRAAQDLERRGGAAEVNFNLSVYQTNNYEGNPYDPQNDIAFDRQVRQIVRAMFDELDMGRRLDRALPARG